jgi:hypothetical protein
MSVAATRVDWAPQADYKHLVLTVAGPEGFYVRRELPAGEAPSFSALDSPDGRLPDGVYAYELRSEGSAVQSGYLWIQGGSFVDRIPADVKPPVRKVTAQETDLPPGGLVVQGQACIGADCVPGDGTGGSALKIKEFGNRVILFDAGCCYPSENDWSIQATDAATLSPNFMIRDLTGATIPFTISAGAPTNAFTILNNGNIGLGTLTPAAQLHIRGTDTGFRNRIFVENASGTTTPREMLEIRNNGGAVFIFKDSSVAQRWGVGTNGSTFIIDNQANSGVEFTLSSTGNLTIGGTLTQNSDRDTKHGIVPVLPDEILSKALSLPISTWVRDGDAARHLGPMAQDFSAAFGLGEDERHIAPVDMAGVSLASIQALNSRMTTALAAKDAEIETLRQANSNLAERLAVLEQLVSGLSQRPQGATEQATPTPNL